MSSSPCADTTGPPSPGIPPGSRGRGVSQVSARAARGRGAASLLPPQPAPAPPPPPSPPPPPGRALRTSRAASSTPWAPACPPAGAGPAPLAAIKWLVKEMQVSACGGAAAVGDVGCVPVCASGSKRERQRAGQCGSCREMPAASAPCPAAPTPGGPSAWGSASP